MRRLVLLLPLLALAFGAPVAAAAPVSARGLLAELRTAQPQGAGYDRDLFDHWIDADGDGCDTRDEVLIQEARTPPGLTGRCRLVGGRWWSAYDDLLITSARRLDIDHFVPLAEAWRSGARRWDADTRRRFANDLDYPLTLIAVTAATNRSKSDQDPTTWLPPFGTYRCTYVASWIAVKWRWRLTVDVLERGALTVGLSGCGRRALVPKPRRAPVGIGSGAGQAAGGGQAATPATGARDPRFGSCREAKAAGYGPYVSGRDPEYAWYRDGDGDGTVCE
ncbi:MAG: excalibur calcium-binding domain-containing protein [Actinomycetota bacterium]